MVKEVYAIDKKNRKTLWQGAIQKEMENVKIAFQMGSSMSIATLHSTLKWRIFVERHA